MEDEEIDNLLQKVSLNEMLEFETQIFLDILHEDGLVVAAKGLNLERVILNLLKVYCDPGNLVFVVNTSESEEKFFKERLGNENVYVTTCDKNVGEREDNYLSGGVHFVTTRILVMDFLKKRVPIDKITGILVLRAHKIIESCQEAFALRLYRQNNKTGFIKAFSNSVQSFTMSFGNVEHVMRSLFVKKLQIWPRFHSTVVTTFKDAGTPQVIELHIPITEAVARIQSYLLDLMNLTVKELKRINKTVEIEEITTENCLIKKFHKILQGQLDLIWHQLSSKSKQLIADLKTLRHLILTLFYNDSVTFYSMLSGYRSIEYAQTSYWVLLKPAELLFTYSSTLIFSKSKELCPEVSSKWKYLLELLKVEIPQEIKKNSGVEKPKILILCSDNKTCYQLNEILTNSAHYYLFLMALKKKIQFKSVSPKFGNFSNKIEDTTKSEEEDFKNSYILTMSQNLLNLDQTNAETEDLNQSQFEPFSQLENMNLTQICEQFTAPTVLIQTFKGSDHSINLESTLHEIQPDFIIMYHSNVTAIREIEMYEAHRPKNTSLKVYFLIHAGTVEEQSYLTALRREKEAFEHLIETKSKMVVPEDQDGKTELCNAFVPENEPSKNTRQGGGETIPKKQTIIVDMREFRSQLPSLLHKRGLNIEPVTITVGDYLLTPQICVERKSISDLIGSLNTGRLYQQCRQMARHYTQPMLLIEFDQNKPFMGFGNNYMLSNDEPSFDIQQKLILLTIHFPKLKIIWSPNPYATAQLFEELKQNKEDPNLEHAMSISGDTNDIDVIHSKYNDAIYDFMAKLPGVNTKNIDCLLRNTESLEKLLKMSKDDIFKVLGNKTDSEALFAVLHDELKQTGNAASSKSGKSGAKFKKFKSNSK